MDNRHHRPSSAFSRIISAAAVASGAAVFLMMMIGAADVILENVADHPIPGTLEATEALMAVAVFLSLGWTQQAGGHIRVTLFTGRLPAPMRRWLERVAAAASAIFYGLLAWQAARYAWRSAAVREYVSGIFPFPVYPAKIVMACGLLLMTVQCLKQVFSGGRATRR